MPIPKSCGRAQLAGSAARWSGGSTIRRRAGLSLSLSGCTWRICRASFSRKTAGMNCACRSSRKDQRISPKTPLDQNRIARLNTRQNSSAEKPGFPGRLPGSRRSRTNSRAFRTGNMTIRSTASFSSSRPSIQAGCFRWWIRPDDDR